MEIFNFQTHGRGKQLGPIIHKYIKFLYQYTIHEPQQSSLILHKYVNLLRYGDHKSGQRDPYALKYMYLNFNKLKMYVYRILILM